MENKTAEQVELRLTFKQLFKRLIPWLRQFPFEFFLVLFFIFGATLASRALPWILGRAIDEGVVLKNHAIYKELVWIYFGCEVTKMVFTFLKSYYFKKVGNRVLYLMRSDLVNHVFHLPLDYFNKTPAGRTMTRLSSDVLGMADLFSEGVINVFGQSVNILATFVAMSLISMKLSFAVALCLPLFIYLYVQTSSKIRMLLHKQKQKLSLINSFLSENLNGIKVTQLYNQTKKIQEKFQNLTQEYRLENMQTVRAYAWLQPILNMFNATMIAVALYLGGKFGQEKLISLGLLVTFLTYVQDLVHPIREILERYQQFQHSLTSADRVFALFDESTQPETGTLANQMIQGHVEFKNLTFRYNENSAEVLKNISFKIPKGKSVAIIGRTGSGKTTLISLLQRFYEPPPNSIFIDGIAIENLTLTCLRRQIGVVQQDPFLFKGSILENITLQDPEIDTNAAANAAKIIGFDRLLAKTGRNLDTMVDEKGANLSAGERQLVAFARILTFNPSVLILDEATANIDSATEEVIHQATKKALQDRTGLIIAHRLSTIRDCDMKIELQLGEIVQTS